MRLQENPLDRRATAGSSVSPLLRTEMSLLGRRHGWWRGDWWMRLPGSISSTTFSSIREFGQLAGGFRRPVRDIPRGALGKSYIYFVTGLWLQSLT